MYKLIQFLYERNSNFIHKCNIRYNYINFLFFFDGLYKIEKYFNRIYIYIKKIWRHKTKHKYSIQGILSEHKRRKLTNKRFVINNIFSIFNQIYEAYNSHFLTQDRD